MSKQFKRGGSNSNKKKLMKQFGTQLVDHSFSEDLSELHLSMPETRTSSISRATKSIDCSSLSRDTYGACGDISDNVSVELQTKHVPVPDVRAKNYLNDVKTKHASNDFDSMHLFDDFQHDDASVDLNAKSQPKDVFETGSWKFVDVGGFYMPRFDIKKETFSKQEKNLVRDIIYALTGVPTHYVQMEEDINRYGNMDAMDLNKVKFRIHEDVHSNLRALALEILPTITHYILVQNYAESDFLNAAENGQVHIEIIAVYNNYLAKYYDMLSNLEQKLLEGQLDMEKFILYVRPLMPCMEFLAKAATDFRNLNSTQILSYLLAKYNKNDELINTKEVRPLAESLLTAAMQPYLKIVQNWIQQGIIDDPKHEFFIEDRGDQKKFMSIKCVDYWESRYKLHKNRIPKIFEQYMQLIYDAGKFLNMLRKCHVNLDDLATISSTPLVFKPNEYNTENIEIIRKCYDYSSKKLLDYFIKDLSLLKHLNSIKQFMLLQISDFVAAFYDECDGDLDKSVKDIEVRKVRKLFSIALETSTAKHDAHGKYLKCDLLRMSLIEQMESIPELMLQPTEAAVAAAAAEDDIDDNGAGSDNELKCFDSDDIRGYEAFVIQYKLDWPYTLVHSDAEHTKLQLIFRELFFLKHVIYHLKKLTNERTHVTRKCKILRDRMIYIIGSIEQYMTLDVIEPNWRNFIKLATQAENIDCLRLGYNNFIKYCLDMGLISDSVTFIRSIFIMGHICLNFCHFIETPCDDFFNNNEADFDQHAADCELEFNGILDGIIDLVKDTVEIANLQRPRSLLKRLQFDTNN